MPAAGEIMEQLAGVLSFDRREVNPQARISTVAAMFAPRPRAVMPAEEPVDLLTANGDQP